MKNLSMEVIVPSRYALTPDKRVRKCQTDAEIEEASNSKENVIFYSQVTTAKSYYEIATIFTTFDASFGNAERPLCFLTIAQGFGHHNQMAMHGHDYDASFLSHVDAIKSLLKCEGKPGIVHRLRGRLLWLLKGMPPYAKPARNRFLSLVKANRVSF